MSYVESVLTRLKEQNPNEPEFHQAATEVLNSLQCAIDANIKQFYKQHFQTDIQLKNQLY